MLTIYKNSQFFILILTSSSFSYSLESLLNISGILSASFKIKYIPMTLTPLLSFDITNLKNEEAINKSLNTQKILNSNIKNKNYFYLFIHNFEKISNKTFLSEALSNLFPKTTKGKFSGSLGAPCIRNSSLQLSSDSNDFLIRKQKYENFI